MSIKAVIFDYDGVIADTFMNQYRVMKYISELAGNRFPYRFPKQLKDDYTEPFTIMYERCGFSWEHDEHFIRQHFDEFQAAHSHDVRLVHGIDEVIQKLDKEGYKLGIVTQNTKSVVRSKLEQCDLATCFNSIMTFEDVARIKPYPDGIIRCLFDLGIYSDEAVYVGDMPSDVMTAKAAGTGSISFLGGYGSMKKFKELPKEAYDYTVFIKKPKQILTFLNERVFLAKG